MLMPLFSCQSGDGRGVGLETPPETPVEELYPPKDFLQSPSQIDGWVSYVNSKVSEFEQKGPVTIERQDGNYEVSAALAGGEIIMLYVVKPGGRVQQWYYLNQYLLPTLREKGRTPDGEHYERRLYYYGPERYLGGRERRAESAKDLETALWYKFIPEEADKGLLDVEAVRRSALDFVNGR